MSPEKREMLNRLYKKLALDTVIRDAFINDWHYIWNLLSNDKNEEDVSETILEMILEVWMEEF